MDAVSRVVTGSRPTNRPAFSTPNRAIPPYHSRNTSTVSTIDRYASVAASGAEGSRIRPSSPSGTAGTRSIGTDSRQAQVVTLAAPRRGSTEAASSEKHTSPTNAPSAPSRPTRSACPPPCTRAAPATTTADAATSPGAGRDRRSSGPATAIPSGAAPTMVPTIAGSACRSAASRQTLNPAMPVAASSSSRPNSARVGRTASGRSTTTRIAAATAYRIA